jgi:7-carboxy-7-deazaguanine synthase
MPDQLQRTSQIPVTDPEAGLKITEIFCSLQGESGSVGALTTFVRLTGCPLRCSYCDTPYAFSGGSRHSLDWIIDQVKDLGARQVCVTGGEPLAQPNALPLLNQLCDAGFQVSLETAGALTTEAVDPRVRCVVDFKCPSSGESEQNLLSNLAHLKPIDELKFVIGTREDYEWSQDFINQHPECQQVSAIWFSPVFDSDTDQIPDIARDLAQWMLEDRSAARLGLQIHKLLWKDAEGR